MRSWLDLILQFIGSESLTDPEYESIDQSDLTIQLYNQAAYDELAQILEDRESVSTLQERLVAVFKAKGTDVSENETGSSNIYIGSVLE